jgi:hypothetical protein
MFSNRSLPESTQFVEKKYRTIITWPVSDLYPSIPLAGGLSIIFEWNESVRSSPSFRFLGRLFTLGMKYSTSVAHFTLYALFMVSFSKGSKQDRQTRESTGRRCICCHGRDFNTKLMCSWVGGKKETETHVIIRDRQVLFSWIYRFFCYFIAELTKLLSCRQKLNQGHVKNVKKGKIECVVVTRVVQSFKVCHISK